MTIEERGPNTQRSVDLQRQKRRAKYDRRGPCAILASAWGTDYELIPAPAPVAEGGVAAVMIMGPLTHHGGWWGCDTYDSIEEKVSAALATSASVVVLKIDSPGGDVDGAFECSKTLRNLASAAGKKLVAYVDECAASAAYALACACDAIYLPASARCGSVGVIEVLIDESARNAAQGLAVSVLTSGQHKADGNPLVQLSDGAKAEFQRQVDGLGLQFCTLVAEARKLPVATVQALEAKMFVGQDAVRAGLADAVLSWSDLLATVATGNSAPASSGGKETQMGKLNSALIALRALAEDEDDKVSGKAKLALQMLEEDKPAAEDEPPPSSKPEEDKETDEEKAKAAKAKAEEEQKEADAKAKAAAEGPAMQALLVAQSAEVKVKAMEAERQAEKDAAELSALLATRPDLNADVVKELRKASLPEVRRFVKNAPRAVAAVTCPAAAAPTRGEGQFDQSEDPEMAKLMDLAMGIQAQAPAPYREGGRMVFPMITPEQARARARAQSGGAK